jgi:hypothetical protein
MTYITQYRMDVGIITQDHEQLNNIVIGIQRQLAAMTGVEYEVSPLLARQYDPDEPPRATIYEGAGE